MAVSEDLLKLRLVKEKYEKQLLTKANVTGVAVGLKMVRGQLTNEPCIVVFVKKKLALSELKARDVIPKALEGFKTDVVEAEFKALQRTSKIRPACGGISVGHYLITAGTITNIFYDYTKANEELADLALASNNHVIANSDYCQKGDMIFQPGPYDGGTENDVIAYLDRWYPLRGEQYRVIDGAVGTPIRQDAVTPSHYDFGVLSPPAATPELYMEIQKGGRTTGLTEAVITATGATIAVSGYPWGATYFINQIVGYNYQRWIAGGDSGSLAVEKETKKCLGVVFAGDTSGCFGVMNNYMLFSSLLEVGLPALLRIYVTDLEGKPVKKAMVMLPDYDIYNLTDASGYVCFGNLPSVVKVVISHPDYSMLEEEIKIEGVVKTVTLKLSPPPPKPPYTQAEMLAYAGAYLGVTLGGITVAHSLLIPEIFTLVKELKEEIVK